MTHTLTEIDVLEVLMEKMCFNCPHFGNLCMPDMNQEGDNFEQMSDCTWDIAKRIAGEYPQKEEVIPFVEDD